MNEHRKYVCRIEVLNSGPGFESRMGICERGTTSRYISDNCR